MSWISRIASTLHPARTWAALDDELKFHLEERIDELVHSGMDRPEAVAVARRQLGGMLQVRESSHDIKTAGWLESVLRDARVGLRTVMKQRTVSVAAILSMALATGACTAAFCLIDGLILRPLPLPSPRRIIAVTHTMPAFLSPNGQPHESDVFSYAQYEALRDTAAGSADLFAMQLSGGLQPVRFQGTADAVENVRVDAISGRGFGILGVRPVLGRLILPDDDSRANGHPVAVLSDTFRQAHFSGAATVLGRWVAIGRMQFQVVGVASAPFDGVQPGYRTDIWVPLTQAADPRQLAQPDFANFSVWGRLHPGTKPAQLKARLQPVFTRFMRDLVRTNPPRNLNAAQQHQLTDAPLGVRDASMGRDSYFREVFRQPLWILGIICALLLLIACSNIANLMVARSSARVTEMAVRVSLGAGRARLVRQMMIEAVELALAAWLPAVLFAALAVPVLIAHLGPSEFPASLPVVPGMITATFALGLSLATALSFGLGPALRASSISPDVVLRAGEGRHTGRVRSLGWILAAQIAFSVAVLFVSGLLLLSFVRLITVKLGFSPDHVILFDLAPRGDMQPRPGTAAELLQRVRSFPGVQAASLSGQRPMGGDMVWIGTPIIRFPGRVSELIRPTDVPVSGGFFEAMKIPFIAGRDFLPVEMTANSTAVIVNQAFADTFLRERDPVGQVFSAMRDDGSLARRQIVGVVGNIRYNNLREADRAAMYTPLGDAAGATLNVRTASESAEGISRLRTEIESAAPDLTVRSTILLTTQIGDTLIRERLLALLAGFFSIVILLLTGVGIYGVIRFATVRRTREMGIRTALGLRPAGIMRLILSDTSIPVMLGMVSGTAGGVALARYVASQLFDVRPTDLLSLAAPLACMLVVALAAVLPPALSAARADPLVALRHE